MTRDEAIEIVARGGLPTDSIRIDAITFVDICRYLGLLKLDEPKSVRTKTLDALFKHFGASDIESVIGLLDEAGLRIVEK